MTAPDSPARTLAETISAALGDNGETWRTNDGRTIDDLIVAHGGVITRDDSCETGDTWRADFSDGSCITSAGSAWDFGFPGCFCWAGAGHHDDCQHA